MVTFNHFKTVCISQHPKLFLILYLGSSLISMLVIKTVLLYNIEAHIYISFREMSPKRSFGAQHIKSHIIMNHHACLKRFKCIHTYMTMIYCKYNMNSFSCISGFFLTMSVYSAKVITQLCFILLISLSRACIHPIISPKGKFNRSSILLHNGFNNLFPDVQETTHFMEVGRLKKIGNAWWCTSIQNATSISCSTKGALISEISVGILYILSDKMFFKCFSLI